MNDGDLDQHLKVCNTKGGQVLFERHDFRVNDSKEVTSIPYYRVSQSM